MIFGVFTLVAVSGIIMMMIAVSKNLPTSLFTTPEGSSFQIYHPLTSTRKLPLNDILDWTIRKEIERWGSDWLKSLVPGFPGQCFVWALAKKRKFSRKFSFVS